MAKIILLYVVTLLMIFPLFWNHGNATTLRKLGIRQNTVTSLSNTNKVTSRGSAGQYSLVSSPSVHTNAETLHILGSRSSVITSLPNTKKATFDGPGHKYFTISSSSVDHANIATPHILGARHYAVTGKATFDGSEHQDSLIPSSSAHTNVIIPGDPLVNLNEATSPKLGKHQNPIIITSLSNTNEATNSDESGFRLYPISSSSPTQTDIAHYFHRFSPSQMSQPIQFKVTPRKLWASRHNGVTSLSNTNKAITSRSSGIFQRSPISSSSAHTQATTRRILQTRHSGATSLSDTNKAITSRGLSAQHSPISSSSAHTHAPTRRILQTRVGGIASLSNTNKAITSRASSGFQHSPISRSSAHKHATTRRILQTRVSGGTSLSDTSRAITSRGSAIQYYPISSSSAHTHATTPSTLGARHNTVTSYPNVDDATTRKHGAHQNPIIITSLPSKNGGE